MKNRKDDNSLTGRELTVMKCIWEHNGDISAIEIQKILKEKYNLEYERSTITTFILHLREKGYIDCYKKGQIVYYFPLVAEDNYAKDRVREFTDFWFHGSMSKLIAAYVGGQGREISPDEQERIKKIIDDLDK